MDLDPENLAALRTEFPGCEFIYSAFDFLLIALIPGPPPGQVTADEHDDLRAKPRTPAPRPRNRRPTRTQKGIPP
jgi:hypothetical protein